MTTNRETAVLSTGLLAEFLLEVLQRGELLSVVAAHAPNDATGYADLMQPTLQLFKGDMLDLRRRATAAGIFEDGSEVGPPILSLAVPSAV